MEKDFDGWHRLKEELDLLHRPPTFQQREIWWCSIGVNIGHEANGKSRLCNRPVLIVRKFNAHIFLGGPLTTQIKANAYYLPIHFKGQQQCVTLSQLRLWDGKRLTHKLGKLSVEHFETVRKALRDMI